MMKFDKITCVDASDFSREVDDYCVDREISTHYQNDVVYIDNDDNPFANWLRENGYEFEDKKGDWIGIWAT